MEHFWLLCAACSRVKGLLQKVICIMTGLECLAHNVCFLKRCSHYVHLMFIPFLRSRELSKQSKKPKLLNHNILHFGPHLQNLCSWFLLGTNIWNSASLNYTDGPHWGFAAANWLKNGSAENCVWVCIMYFGHLLCMTAKIQEVWVEIHSNLHPQGGTDLSLLREKKLLLFST